MSWVGNSLCVFFLSLCSFISQQEVFSVFLHSSPRVWPFGLNHWIKQLTYFLSFFPGADEVASLRELHASMRTHMKNAKREREQKRFQL